MSWLFVENQFSDEEHSNQYAFGGKSSIPKMKQSRKRSSSSAGLQEFDSLVDSFERRLKLTPSTLERLKVADEIIQDPVFVLTLMKLLPEYCVRKLAVTCSKWRAHAYQTLRTRKGNNAFSVLWVDNPDEDSLGSEEGEFDFSLFHHQAYFAVANFVTASNCENVLPLRESRMHTSCPTGSNTNLSEYLQCEEGNIDFILTYGSENMESNIMTSEDNWKAKDTGCASLLVLSSSVIATTPDCKQMVDAVSSITERKLVTSIMFPKSTHILFECFVVPSIISDDSPACVSSIAETCLKSAKKPKALILYQYLNLIDSEPGIVQVLQTLKMTHESAGFPMVTGIYNFLDANFPEQSNQESCDPVATGLLICGDDSCDVSVISVNLAKNDDLEATFQQIEQFYGNGVFSTKYTLLFYHNEVTNFDAVGALPFKSFIECFRSRLPDVNLHGMGSLSGAHAMFVNPDSNKSFNQLNIRMMELTGTEHSKTSFASLEVVLVLLAYQAEQD